MSLTQTPPYLGRYLTKLRQIMEDESAKLQQKIVKAIIPFLFVNVFLLFKK